METKVEKYEEKTIGQRVRSLWAPPTSGFKDWKM